MLLKERTQHYIFYYLLIIQAFVFPLWRSLTPLIIILTFITILLDTNFLLRIKLLLKGKKLIFLSLFISFYLLYLIGLFYTSNFIYARFDLEVKLTFLLIPLFFFSSSLVQFSKQQIVNILISFVSGCFVSSIISIVNSFLLYKASGNTFWFFYTYVSYFYHPSYITMYILFAMVIIAFILLNALFKSTKIRLLFIFLLIWFTFYVIILSSKAGIVCLLIIAFFLLLNLIIKRKLYILSLIIFFVLISFVIVGIKKFPMLTDRVNTTIQAINSSEKDINKEDGTVQRIEIWKTSITLIKENFLIGVGTGDVKDALLKSYDEKGMTFAKNKNLNAHSQYFQTFITLGIIGFLILLSLFIFPLIHAFKNRNFIYLFFLLIVAINIAVESMFENQAGVVFYTFFNSFLFLTGRQLADKNKLN